MKAKRISEILQGFPEYNVVVSMGNGVYPTVDEVIVNGPTRTLILKEVDEHAESWDDEDFQSMTQSRSNEYMVVLGEVCEIIRHKGAKE
jgi:hypothetical protein